MKKREMYDVRSTTQKVIFNSEGAMKIFAIGRSSATIPTLVGTVHTSIQSAEHRPYMFCQFPHQQQVATDAMRLKKGGKFSSREFARSHTTTAKKRFFLGGRGCVCLAPLPSSHLQNGYKPLETHARVHVLRRKNLQISRLIPIELQKKAGTDKVADGYISGGRRQGAVQYVL